MNRREFVDFLGRAGLSAALAGCTDLRTADKQSLYALPEWGAARLLHITDTHAQLQPIYL